MKEYRLDPAALPKRKRTVSMVGGVAVAVAAGVGIVLPWYVSPAGSPIVLRIFPLIFLSGIGIFGIRKIRGQLTRQWQGFSISSDGSKLVVNDPLAGEERILRADVQKVTKRPGKGLMVHAEGHPPLLVSEMLLGYSELEAELGAWGKSA